MAVNQSDTFTASTIVPILGGFSFEGLVGSVGTRG